MTDAASVASVVSKWKERPDYRIEISPRPGRLRVWQGDVLLADTTRALLLVEQDHADVVYLPMEDLRAEQFVPSDHHTICPFKGRASYLSVVNAAPAGDGVFWFYPDPFDEVAAIRGHGAFYADRVRVESVDG